MENADALNSNWKSYMAAFEATDRQERDRHLELSVSEDVDFKNPGGEGKGREALSAHIATFQNNMPGVYFTTDKIYVHHNELLAIWSLCKRDGSKLSTGYNFVRPGEDGRFQYMAGFF